MSNLLMTGAGAPGAPGILKCLQEGNYNIWCSDSRENVVGRFLNGSGHFFTTPLATDPSFVDEILRACIEHKINLILPLVTRELFPFSEQKKRFEENGIRVLVSDKHALAIANDKGKLYRTLDEKGARKLLPDYVIINSYEELEQGFARLSFPQEEICVKPCVSNGSRGFRILSNRFDNYDLLLNQKPNAVYMHGEELLTILSGKTFPQLLLSEYLPGTEYSVDCIAQHGRCMIAIPRSRTKMNGGISVEGTVEENKTLIEYSREIIERIGLHGNIGLQLKQDRHGDFKLLEINPRVQGTIVAAHGAGVNLPLLAVDIEMGKQIDFSSIQPRWGTRFIRYWEEVLY